jgi:hypothetical protein
MATINGKARVEANGESKMPVWGEIFEKEASVQKDPVGSSSAKIKALAEYIQTIQR